MNRSLYSQLLNPDGLRADSGASQGQISYFRNADPVSIYITGHFYHRFIRKIGNTAFIHYIKMSPVHFSCFQRFYNIGAMFLPSL